LRALSFGGLSPVQHPLQNCLQSLTVDFFAISALVVIHKDDTQRCSSCLVLTLLLNCQVREASSGEPYEREQPTKRSFEFDFCREVSKVFKHFSQSGSISDTHGPQHTESASLYSLAGIMSDQVEPEDIKMSVETEDKGTDPSDGVDGVASHLPTPPVHPKPPQAEVSPSGLQDDAEPLLWKGDLIRVSERYVSTVQ
jgi:hypothetical protein